MTTSEIFLEHKRGDKVQKYLRVGTDRDVFMIGSSSRADLRINGEGIMGCHAVLRYRAPSWFICDVSGTESLRVNGEIVTESPVDQTTRVEIQGHALNLFAKERSSRLFDESKATSGDSLHQIVIRVKGAVVETHLLDAKSAFKFNLGDQAQLLPPPASSAWITTVVGPRTVHQRLVGAQELMNAEGLHFDRDLRKPMIISFLFMLLMIGSLWTLSKSQPKDSQLTLDNRSREMIFDAKTVKKMRAESKKVVKERAAKARSTEAMNEPAPAPVHSAAEEATAPKPSSKASAAVTSLRQSGLSALIGKIAKRANKQGAMIAATGVAADKVGSGRAIFSTGSSLNTGGGTAATAAPNFRIGGVGTHGRAGGVGAVNLRDGSKLAGGTVGLGGVVALANDEDTVVEGGLDKDAIADVIRRNIGQIRYCYERQLSSNPDLYGKVLVRFTIGAAGDVGEPRVDNTTLKSAMVEGCILRRMASWKFPLPKGGTQVRVSYPFLFKALD
jgi:outer membrane biosynthesis protein TonB